MKLERVEERTAERGEAEEAGTARVESEFAIKKQRMKISFPRVWY